MTLVDIIKNSSGMGMVDEEGNEEKLRLLPPATTAELATLEAEIPCPIPSQIRDILAVARGFDNGPLESFDFAGISSAVGMEEIFPHSLALAHDGYGNYWVADLHPDSSDWGPIYFACHDPPVIVFQSPTLEHFVSEFLRFANPPHESELDSVHEMATKKIWRENPGAIPAATARKSSDSSLATFASTLDDSYLIVDLRHARVGDGFSWGRFGPRTNIVRSGRDPVFAYKAKSWWQQLLGR